MSESSLYLLSLRLRLLARADVRVNASGDPVSGQVRPTFERAFNRASALMDLIMDGDQLQASDIAWLARAQSRVQALRPHVRALEAEVI